MAPKTHLTKESSVRTGPLKGSNRLKEGVSRVYWPSARGIHGLCWLSRGERSHCFLWLTSAEMQESSCKQNQHNQAMGDKAGHPGRPTTQAALQGGPFSWAVRTRISAGKNRTHTWQCL